MSFKSDSNGEQIFCSHCEYPITGNGTQKGFWVDGTDDVVCAGDITAWLRALR